MGADICPQCGAELPPGAHFCAYCGVSVHIDRARMPLDERRVISALFADLAGSTQLGERLDPEDFRDLTGGALAIMGAAIEELGGTVRGTAGDGVLGLFGAPTAHEDDAERAVIAGLRLVERMREYADAAAERWGVTNLHVRVGIETGLAVLGEVRAGKQVQYDASGDCLNTAARLEGAADVDGVLVGPLTHRLVTEAFDWGEQRRLVLKGKAEPVLARHASGWRSDRPQRGSESGARLVGRDDELAVADDIVTDVKRKHRRTVFVTGQAGIGKTRLMAEFRSLLAAAGQGTSSPVWLEGTCLSYAMNEPYLPFRQVLRQALGRGVDSTAAVLEAMAPVVGMQRAEDVAPVLGMVLGLPPEDGSFGGAELSAESLQQLVIAGFAEVVVGLAARGPVAIALDDLHWADAATLRLAAGLIAELADEVPVLFVLTMRPERDSAAWTMRERTLQRHPQRACELRLTSLDHDSERSLISDLIGEGTLPTELESMLLDRAEGNPFYLRELIRSLGDTGAIVESQGRWTFDHDATIEIPETVERVVLARIDRLAPADRALLNSAAVIGREFDVALLGGIADADLSPAALSNLTNLGLFEAASDAEYRFSHPLIQETAYRSMLRRGRADLHRRAAAAIEGLADHGSDTHHAVLAGHHSAAGQVADAAKYHRLAALAALRIAALEEALNQLDFAVAATGSLDPESARAQLPELHLLRGRARGRNGDFEGGAEDVTQALAGARVIGDRLIEMQALTDLGWLVRSHGYEEAIGLHQQALRMAEELDDPSTQVTALSRLSLIYLNRLQLDHGLEVAERALRIARATGQDQLLGQALDCLKLAALQLGNLELLDRTVAEIVEVQSRAGDSYLTTWAYIEGATAPLARGDYGLAQELIDKALESTSRFGADRITRAMMLEERSWIERARGDLSAAISTLREAWEAIGEYSAPEWSAWLGASLGSHLVEQGNAHEAIPVLKSALEHSEAAKIPNRAFRAAAHLAWAYQLVGDADGSRTALAQAEHVLAAISAPPGDVFLDGHLSYLAIARTRSAFGDSRGARAVLIPLLEAARRHGWCGAEQEATTALAELGDDAPGLVSDSDVPVPPGQGP